MFDTARRELSGRGKAIHQHADTHVFIVNIDIRAWVFFSSSGQFAGYRVPQPRSLGVPLLMNETASPVEQMKKGG